MNFQNFCQAAWEVLYSLSPTIEDIAKRERLINEFKRFVEDSKIVKGNIFEPYGSYATELYTKYGDVDLSVRVEHKNALSVLKRSLDLSGEYSSIKFVTKARVPVLKFKHKASNVPVDVTVYTDSGKTCAMLLSHLKDMDIRFRELVLLVKGWAMCHDLHGASNGGFSSLALYMMVIFHFQTIKPAIFPPLSVLCTSDVTRKIEVGDGSWITDFDVNITNYKKSRGLEENNEWDIYKVFYSFIKEFKHIGGKAKCYYMSVKRGRWVLKTSLMNKAPLWMEEPFGEQENIARAIKDVKRIGCAFKATDKVIKTGNKDDILQMLGSKNLLKMIESTNWDTIPIRYTLEVGPEAVASRDGRISLSSSAAIIPQSSVKSSSISHGDVLGLGGYASDDEEDKEVQISSIPSVMSSSTSPGDILGLRCYASDDDDAGPD